MKRLALSVAVCEYNPFHNGHKLHIDRMKQTSDAVAVIMSGNFCQRGEIACLDKYARAKHAILSGADIVFELPTVFSVAPAEIFACGAIKLLDSLPADKTLCFGTEKGDAEDFYSVAKAVLTETKEFKEELKRELSSGAPYAVARCNALKTAYPDIDFSMLETPNAVLGIEYVKAILKNRYDIQIMPILREGGYNDVSLDGNFASALAIRSAIEDGKKNKVKKFVPECVFEDLPKSLPDFSQIALFRTLEASKIDLKNVVDCTEGLENRIKALSPGCKTVKELVDKAETKRYTRARLQRIITANALNITKDFTEKCLKSNLYLKVLAVASDKTWLLSTLSGGKNKLITRKADADTLSGTQKACFLKDVYANDIYNLVTKNTTNEYEMKIVKR